MQEQPFLGQWRQIRPDPAPAAITVHFEPEGRLTYVIDGQHVPLTWRVEEDTLIVDGNQRSRYRFRSPAVLILERGGERYVYYRV